MSFNSLNSTPVTPFPDPPDRDVEQPDPMAGGPVDSPLPPSMVKPTTSSADDLSLLLAQAAPDPYLTEGEPPQPLDEPAKPQADVDGPEPAPFLGSLSSSENELDITFSPPPDQEPAASSTPSIRPPEPTNALPDDAPSARVSWPLLLVSSYASAMTLALGFILWTGRGLWRTDSGGSSEPPSGISSGSNIRGAGPMRNARPPIPAPNLTTLGRPLRLGELEVTPRFITRRPVYLLRLEGAAEGERESTPVLVMTLELANRSTASSFAPLDPAIVRDPVPTVDQSFIELPGDHRIAMFRLAIESEWSIQDQAFPTLQPGDIAETILVSEPVAMSDLAGTMTWHVKLRTAPYRTDVLGVQFTAQNVVDGSF